MSGPRWRVDFRPQHVLANGDGLGCGALGHLEVETAVLVDGLGLVTRGGRHFMLLRPVIWMPGFWRCERRSWEGAMCRSGRPCRNSRRQSGRSSQSLVHRKASFMGMHVHPGAGHCTTVEACAWMAKVGLKCVGPSGCASRVVCAGASERCGV